MINVSIPNFCYKSLRNFFFLDKLSMVKGVAMEQKLKESKDAMVRHRSKIIAIIIWCVIPMSINNQFRVDLPLKEMLVIDITLLICAVFLTVLNLYKVTTLGMYVASAAIGWTFLAGTIDTHLYGVMFASAVIISIYSDWKAIVINTIVVVAGFNLHFKTYVDLGDHNELALVLHIMYFFTVAIVIVATITSEKTRKKMIISQYQLEKSQLEMQDLLKESQKSEAKLLTFSEKLNQKLNETQNIGVEITQSYRGIAGGMGDQTQNLTNINYSLHEIGEMVTSLSKTSKTMSKYTEETESVTKAYSAEMVGIANEMDRLASSIESTSHLIHKLNDKNDKISNILVTLNSLSAQTNLLALNASIEAARAGEHGKSFGVVAGEVKKLAEDSKKFSEMIGGILSEIKTETVAINTQIKEELFVVESNKKTIENAGSTFLSISDNASSIHQYSNENEKTVSMLDSSSQTIIVEMTSLAGISEEINASIEEILSSMENQNQNLDDVLSSFPLLKK